jgi:uncharacterized protein (TIGR03435 family)
MAIAGPLMIGVVRAQEGPRFEVASIKPSPPRDGPDQGGFTSRFGPGSADPIRFSASNVTIPELMLHAYNVKRYQIVAPGWMDSARFDVEAKIAPGATRANFRLMLQNLLAERFGMVTHRESKETQAFRLVQATGGHKLKEYVEEPAAANAKQGGRGAERRLRPGMVMVGNVSGGDSLTVESHGMPMDQIAGMLANYIARPVMNETGLTGKYNVKVHFDPEGLEGAVGERRRMAVAGGARHSEGAPMLFKAVQEQLGLKLEQRKGAMDVIVVDRAEKSPTAN